MKFNEFKLNETLLEGLEAIGFTDATPIQEQAIPKILEGKDLIACAQTGTGKTAAFVLPIIHKIFTDPPADQVSALIIAPTRELALQIDQQIDGLSYFTNVTSAAVYGGSGGKEWDQQKKAIQTGAEILVATPGRLIALLNSSENNLSHIKYLILDEADRMLDMGFYEDIVRIINQLPEKRQTLLFSATMPPKIRKLTQKILHEPEEISIAISKPAEKITQKAFLVYDKQKTPLLQFFLDSGTFSRVIVFASTKEKVKRLERDIKENELTVEAFSSDLEQAEREMIMRDFKAKKVNVLIGTDILSRGIDVENIDLVINYDVPGDAEDYVHRIGRTARAERTGMAVTFINEQDMAKFNRIEELIDTEVPKTNALPARLGEGPQYNPKSGGDKRRFKGRRRN